MKMSDSFSNIFEAFSKFQAEMKNPPKNKTAVIPMKNGKQFTYSYADLGDIVEAIRPVMGKNGLFFLQNQIEQEDKIGVYTILGHQSGEWIEFDPVWLNKRNASTAQDLGSLLTYARRYALCTALGIASDEDTDANDIQKPNEQKQKKQQNQQQQQSQQPQRQAKTQGQNKPQGKPQDQQAERLATQAQQGKIRLMIYEKFDAVGNKGMTKEEKAELEQRQAQADSFRKALFIHYFDVDSGTKLTKAQAHQIIDEIDHMDEQKFEALKLEVKTDPKVIRYFNKSKKDKGVA